MLRYDTTAGAWREVSSTGELARMLIAAGAPVDGLPGDAETPLITAASYGDAEVAAVLIAEGADREAVSADTGGGVPGGTALRHAAVFGMTDVAAVLTAAGARDLVYAAASGSLGGWPLAELPEGDRVAALRIAAEHGHLAIIDQLMCRRHARRRPRPGRLHRITRGGLQRSGRRGAAPSRPRRGPGPPRHALRRDPARLVRAPAWRGRTQRRSRGDRTRSRPGHPGQPVARQLVVADADAKSSAGSQPRLSRR